MKWKKMKMKINGNENNNEEEMKWSGIISNGENDNEIIMA